MDAETRRSQIGGDKEPWNPAQATDRIRSICSGVYDLSYKKHALDQLAERSLITGDLTFLLKNGFVYETPVQGIKVVTVMWADEPMQGG